MSREIKAGTNCKRKRGQYSIRTKLNDRAKTE